MEQDCLSPEEFSQQLAKMSAIELSKVMLVAKAKHVNGTGMEFEDLLAEVFARVMAGSRKVPRDVPIVAYLIETIKSIAFTERKKMGNSNSDDITLISWEENQGELEKIANSASSPDQILEAADASRCYERIAEELREALADDPNALSVLQGRMEGLKPKEIKNRTNMLPHVFDAARKKVDRALLSIKAERD